MQERLQKILSACGVSSRREAERLIAQGLVTVNGEPAALGAKADPEQDEILVRGRPIREPAGRLYIALNKPRGYVTTLKDEKGRRSVDELVADCGVRVYPVGRLDMDSEGLLILTNDGDFANAVMHPAAGKEKIYHVTADGDVNAALEPLRQPFELDGYRTRPARVALLKETPRGGVLSISIGEGRNRQIRRMCEACGLTVKRLVRVQVGEVRLGRLQTGSWRRLTAAEVESLRKAEGLHE